MRETTPDVHLIARPAIDWNAVKVYLQSVDGEPWYENRVPTGLISDDLAGNNTENAGQTLIEFMGRLCYRSWAPELNANVKRVREDQREYLENILSSGHGSVLEHANYSFVFQDVSRVFTHELVRHRAGVAISQESLRFVRLTDLGVRIPEILEPHEHAIVNIVEQLEDFQTSMADKFGLDDDGVPFSYKKEVTSALRRLAPIGVSTTIGWTANIRTLRHVLQMRTAKFAEEEIRHVFGLVGDIMLEECPALFGDFEVDANGQWDPAYGKV